MRTKSFFMNVKWDMPVKTSIRLSASRVHACQLAKAATPVFSCFVFRGLGFVGPPVSSFIPMSLASRPFQRTQLVFLNSVSWSAVLNRACNAIPTKVAIRIAG